MVVYVIDRLTIVGSVGTEDALSDMHWRNKRRCSRVKGQVENRPTRVKGQVDLQEQLSCVK